MSYENKIVGMIYCKKCNKITPWYKSGHCAVCVKARAAMRRKMEKDGELSPYRWIKEHQMWVNSRNKRF